jgi:hypothetical protein
MSDCADNLMLTGVIRPCPDCAGERIFVAPDPCHDAYGAEFACTDCGAALFIDPALFAELLLADGSALDVAQPMCG